MFQVVQLHTIAAPPTAFAPISNTQSTISPLATGLAGLGVGALAVGGYIASRKFSRLQSLYARLQRGQRLTCGHATFRRYLGHAHRLECTNQEHY